MSVAPAQDRSASPRPTRTPTTEPQAQSPVAPASPHRSRDQLPLGDGWTITPSTRRATHRQKPWPKDRPVPQLPDGFARPHCFPPRSLYPSDSSDSGSACSTPDHDYGRTLSAPSRSHGTNPPAALSPLDYDDHLPLQTLRSYQESITNTPQPTGALLGRLLCNRNPICHRHTLSLVRYLILMLRRLACEKWNTTLGNQLRYTVSTAFHFGRTCGHGGLPRLGSGGDFGGMTVAQVPSGESKRLKPKAESRMPYAVCRMPYAV